MLSDHPSKVSSSNHGGSSEYGRRLVPNVIDEAAHETPEREAFSIPRSTNPGDGWRVVTFKDYANAINRCCHMIVERCGKAPEGTFPTIAYIGPNDARYYVSSYDFSHGSITDSMLLGIAIGRCEDRLPGKIPSSFGQLRTTDRATLRHSSYPRVIRSKPR